MKKNRIILLTAVLAIAGLSGCANNQVDDLAKDLAVTKVELDPTFAKLEAGESLQINAIITFKENSVTDCYKEWRSSNQNIVTVSESGLVLALKPGYASVTFIAGYRSASCSITVPDNSVIPITPVDPDQPVVPGEFTISLDSTNLTLGADDTFQLHASTSEQATVVWSSSNESVATVDQNGLVVAIGEGDAVITAAANGKQDTCDITVVAEGEEDVPPSDEMTVRIYFFIDYNNVDEDDKTGKKLLAKFWWYEDRPIAESGKVPANPTQAPIPAFPYFAGWSTHPIIDSRDGLLNLSTYKVSDDGSRSFLYIYGIWTDVQGGM